MKAIKAIVVGRHTPTGKEGIEIVGNEDDQGRPQPRPINFPATAEDCRSILLELFDEAVEQDVKLLFQAIPAQLAVAIHCLIKMYGPHGDYAEHRIGVIVNIPDLRPAGAKKVFSADNPIILAEAVIFANPCATVTGLGDNEVEVLVDPPLRFKFSHVQWFDGNISQVDATQWTCPKCDQDLDKYADMGADGVECPQCGAWVPLP